MAAAAAWLFYQSGIAVVILSPFAVPYCLYRMKGEREKKKRILSEQFRELLEAAEHAEEVRLPCIRIWIRSRFFPGVRSMAKWPA